MTTAALIVGLLALAVAAGYVLGRRARPVGAPRPDPLLPSDIDHLADLVRRANRGLAVSIVTPGRSQVTATHPRGISRAVVERAEAMARLALSDGRTHMVRGGDTTLAVRGGDVALAFVFASPPEDDAVDRVAADLRRLGDGFTRQREREERAEHGPRRLPATAHDSLDSAVAAVCEAARDVADAPAALLIRSPISQTVRVVGVSNGADRRLIGTSAAPDSAVAHAMKEGMPVPGTSAAELFGHYRADRRREERGLVLPIGDGRRWFGALVLFGRPDALRERADTDLTAMLVDVGSHLGYLADVRAAETRAMTDELTGLPNRRALDKAMALYDEGDAALLCLDVDRFKLLNDRYGHVAGDAALIHLASLLRQSLRDRDLAVRMGGEEFALWLPDTPAGEAREVAERVRRTIAETPFLWSGQDITMTCSVGVAAVPHTTRGVANLYPAADAALYRAKERGRNRVEVAMGGRTEGRRGGR